MARTADTIREAKEIRRMFGGIAGTYDLLNHLLSLNRDRRWRRATAALVPAEGPVLDVCTGTGDMALEWSDALLGGESVLGADFCHEMLLLGRDKVARRGLSGRVRMAAADALRLPFPANTFGVVSVAFGIRNVTSLNAGIREMARVTRPGGRVAILEFTMPRNPLFRLVYLVHFLILLPLVGNLVSGTTENAYGYLPRSVLHFPDRRRLTEILEEEGLVGVEAHDLSMGIVNVFVGVKPDPVTRAASADRSPGSR
ncbi:MAG: ubiquinone/menaquinone biosynthesis methyltransferase [Planctomycetota bacterium]